MRWTGFLTLDTGNRNQHLQSSNSIFVVVIMLPIANGQLPFAICHCQGHCVHFHCRCVHRGQWPCVLSGGRVINKLLSHKGHLTLSTPPSHLPTFMQYMHICLSQWHGYWVSAKICCCMYMKMTTSSLSFLIFLLILGL